MFKKVRIFAALSVLMVAAFILGACDTPTPQVIEKIVTQEVKVVETQIVEKEVEKIVEVEKTPEPVKRYGGWLDRITIVEEPSADQAAARLKSGDLGAYFYTVGNAALFKDVQASPELSYSQSYGSYNEITFNPAGPVFEATGKLNPFAVPAIREAMNWLTDRNYIAQEIMGGLAIPKWLPITGGFPDYANYVDVARKVEGLYAYNPDKAKEAITAEMEKLGATLVDGKWQYNNEPVTLIFLIRTEDERRAIGDYLSNQLESIGFTVDRQYKTAAEASPIWQRGNPNDGLFHLYTGGWITTAISRDQGSNFSFFYTNRGLARPLWQAYTPTPEFDEVALKLENNDFKTLDERRELFAQAMEMSIKDSVRYWLVDRKSFAMRRADVSVAYDLAGSNYGTPLWSRTLRYVDQLGGEMTIAMPSMLTEPWNPVAGSNWIYDMAIARGVADWGTNPDPFTGLPLPNRIEKADVVVQQDLPVGASLDWVTLSTAESIEVPADAWVDWDAANQKFLTAAEVYTAGLPTALTKSTVYYPADLFEKVKWHDGTPLSMADFVMGMILTFDQGKPESLVYDEAQAPNLESFLSHFKGVKIVSTSPLVIETYDDLWYTDAENIVTSWWPNYAQGQASWHALVPTLFAERDGALAYSADKATAKGVEQMSLIGGPSLDILKGYLDQVSVAGTLFYTPTLSAYVTAEQAQATYANLNEFYKLNGHFWVNTGPYIVDKIFPVEGTVTLRNNPDYPDLADRWERFSEPKLSEVAIDGEGRVNIGAEAKFSVAVTFKGDAYPQAEIKEVKFLVFDAKGALAYTGAATAVADGQYEVVLPADTTKTLEAGSNKLEVAVVSKVVSIPSFASFEFVTAAP